MSQRVRAIGSLGRMPIPFVVMCAIICLVTVGASDEAYAVSHAAETLSRNVSAASTLGASDVSAISSSGSDVAPVVSVAVKPSQVGFTANGFTYDAAYYRKHGEVNNSNAGYLWFDYGGGYQYGGSFNSVSLVSSNKKVVTVKKAMVTFGSP